MKYSFHEGTAYCRYRKTLLIMRLTAFLLLIGCLHAGAKGVAQTVTLSVSNMPLDKVCKEIERQTGYYFVYAKDMKEKSHLISLVIKNASIEETLARIFAGLPFSWEVIDKVVVVNTVKKNFSLEELPPEATSTEIKGRITNAHGEPLVNASVLIKRTKTGSQTNVNGEFALKNVRPEDVLSISFIGYKPLTVNVGDRKELTLVMDITDDDLDKVVIQGYGTTSQRLATGNIATVTAEEIEKQPVMNPLMALQGRVAGLDIQQTSGYTSAPIKAEIRGRSNVDYTQVSDPLYIIDGVPLTVVAVGDGGNYNTGSSGFLQNGYLCGPASGQSPLFNISPSDIESISVLKDADATSIYGSRGANGVILITTKKGKAGKTQFNIHVEEGINKVTRFWKMLNTPQYLMMRREAFRNDQSVPTIGNAPDLMVWDTTRYTDWQKRLYGKAGKIISANLSLSGGNTYTTFRLGAEYTHSQEITTASGADQRGAVSFNLTHSTINRRFNISFRSTYSFTQSNLIDMGGKISYAPDAPSIYDTSGKLNWSDWESIGVNPFGSLLQPYVAKTNFLNSNLILSYEPIRGLSITTSLGYNNAQSNQLSLIPIASQDPINQPTGTANFGNNSNKNWIVEPQISYEMQLWKGKFSALFGGSAQMNTTDGIYIQGTGYTSDALLHTISNAPNQLSIDNYGEYRYASVFGRVGYNLNNKYIINLNARRDGSSNYGPDNQYGNFASIGGAWLFTEENWPKRYLPFLSFGKLRGSYGITGSDGGKPYSYITRWASSGSPYGNIVPLAATQHANPNYHWQENKKLETAIDLGFFKDWITLSIAYYRNRTGNQLLSYPTPYLSGFTSVIDNLNALVQNAGWEFTLGGKGVHVHNKYFNWDWAPHFTFSINQNKFLSFTGLGASPFRNVGRIGQPLNGRYVLHYTGVDPQTGVYTYQDINHDSVINPNYGPTGDVYFKKTSPTFMTGFGFNFDIKGLSVAFYFVAKKQDGVNAIAQGDNPGRFNSNQPVEVLARWQNPGDITNVGKFSIRGSQNPGGYLGTSDIGYTDASYIRLQNLSLAYSLSDNIAKKAGFQCSVFIHALNLFTITKYKGIDPETQNFGGMPPTKTVVGGLSFNF